MSTPEIHGAEKCPRPCVECPQGDHHWIPSSLDLMDEDIDDHGVLAYDREHGTEHRLGYWACKHCPAWIEDEDVEDYGG